MNTTSKPVVVARLTVSRADGKRTIVEVREGASFHKFYTFFVQDGARRSTKTLLRTASRNEYLPAVNAHRHQPGLDVIEKQLRGILAQSNPVVKTTLRIIKKRAYRKLLNASPDALGLTRVNITDLSNRPRRGFAVREQRAIPVGIWLKSLKQKQVMP